MDNRAYGTLVFVFIIAAFLILCLGVFFLFQGIGTGDYKIILKGVFTLIAGFIISAIANFME